MFFQENDQYRYSLGEGWNVWNWNDHFTDFGHIIVHIVATLLCGSLICPKYPIHYGSEELVNSYPVYYNIHRLDINENLLLT